MRRLFVLVLVGVACGSEPPDPPGSGASIFPVAQGNRWEFRLQDSSGDVSTKIQTVTSTSGDGFVFKTVRGDRETTSVQKVDDQGRLVRLSEHSTKLGVTVERITFVPSNVRVDLQKIELGNEYTHTFLEDHDPSDGLADVEKTQTFTVEAVDEAVTVPAGTFRAIRIRRTTNDGPAKTFWFVKGVGKIKEVGGQLEELTRADIVREETIQ